MEPAPRYRHAAANDGKTLYVWGGSGHTAKVETTKIECFDATSEKWKQPQELHGSLPDGLRGMAVTTEGEMAYSFGGTDSPNFKNLTYYNTLYQINLSTFQCKELVPNDPQLSHILGPQKKSNSAIVHFDQKLVIHGGRTAGGDLTDELHVFDLKTNEWRKRTTTGEAPPPVASHSLTKVDLHRAVMFGGRAVSGKLDDTYILDMKTWHWTKLKVSGAKPPARNSHTTCCVAGPLTGQQHPVLAVIGGNTGDPVGDMWLLDVDNGAWNKVTLPVALTPRDGHSAAVFGNESSCRTLVLFGGYGKNSRLSETALLSLELKEGSWKVTKVVKANEPPETLKEKKKKPEVPPKKASLRRQLTPSTATDGQTPLTEIAPSPTHKVGVDIKVIDISEVKMGKRLGQGGFGAVFEAKWNTKTVAVKVCLGNLLESLSREIEILSSLPPHPNVISFFGVALSSDSISTYIVTELAPNGSLYNYLHVKERKPSPDQSFAWALQVATGMQHLHSNDVVHRDLKSGNILLSYGLLAKVCDFGTARTMAKTAKTTQKGTYRWMAPEIVEGVEADINKMCDVFSYGMVVYEIFACKIPYHDIPTDPMVGIAMMQGKRPPLPTTLPPFLRPLVEACWKTEPKQRPSFESIVVAIQTGSFDV